MNMDSGPQRIKKYRYIVLYDKELKSIVDMFSYADSHVDEYDLAMIYNRFETLHNEQVMKPKFPESVNLILNKVIKFFVVCDTHGIKYVILNSIHLEISLTEN